MLAGVNRIGPPASGTPGYRVQRVVVFMINSLVGGGAERIMARLLSHSEDHARDRDVHLVLLDEETSAYTVPSWVTVHRFDTRGSLLHGGRKLRRLFRELRPDACLSFLTRANLLNILVGGMQGVRVVISERVNTSSHHPDTLAGRISKVLTWAFYRRADHVIAVSGGIADDLRENYRVPRARIAIIANPIDGALIRSKAEEPPALAVGGPYVVGMGRFVPNKNFALLVEAFARSGVAGKLVILGDGPLRSELTAAADGLGLAGRIEMPGFLENPFAVIKAASCYVLPSNGEGFPNGLVEAMTLGVPVISTNCASGPSEILDDQEKLEVTGVHWAKYGVLVPTNDAAAMAEAIALGLEPATRAGLAQAAAAGAARYDLAGAVKRYWDVIEG
jgi:glycosyltransferase involved in cell wall biosynthesis